MVAGDYMNLNARFAYHYSMVDAVVGPGAENNHVYFSFRGGGGSETNRALRARFLERVLRRSRFEVDRRGDEVIAWLRRYPREETERMLERLGRLLVCSRELDATLRNEPSVRMYADYFLKEKYTVFS
jgi:pyruvate,water dikinase